MFNKNKSQKRLLVFGALIITLIFVYVFQTWLLPTLSRYIYREQDEIRAHYTALYFASTGEGKTIALENNEGFVDFDLRNYIGEKVTQRDIVYTISKPSVFYDKDGNEIEYVEDYLNSNQSNELHVLDVWGKPKKVEKSTYLYDVEIVENSGEVYSEGVYAFTYEKLGSSAVGKVHTVTCKVTKKGLEPLDDSISLVVQLSKPYKEVFIINMKVSSRLITFAHKEVDIFNIAYDKIYVQTADLFANYKKDDYTIRTIGIDDHSYYKFTPYAFKLTISWSGYMLDENKLENIHIGTSSSPGGDKYNDAMDPNGVINNSGNYPNPDLDLPYIDLEKSTICKINSLYDNSNGHRGELVMFVPQGADLSLMFLKTANGGTIDVKIEAYITYVFNNNDVISKYLVYSDTDLGGYKHTDDLYNLTKYGN